jgi:hypothetical protein
MMAFHSRLLNCFQLRRLKHGFGTSEGAENGLCRTLPVYLREGCAFPDGTPSSLMRLCRPFVSWRHSREGCWDRDGKAQLFRK